MSDRSQADAVMAAEGCVPVVAVRWGNCALRRFESD
jgi:hypothetical protein